MNLEEHRYSAYSTRYILNDHFSIYKEKKFKGFFFMKNKGQATFYFGLDNILR